MSDEQTAAETADSTETVQSITRALAVIKVFGQGSTAGMPLSEIASRTGLAPATARRVVRTLQEHGYVEAVERRFRLTTKILELGYSYLSSLRFVDLCVPRLEDLVAELGESASVAILEGPNILYVARVTKRRLLTMEISVGTRLPAHATSMGRVLLADLEPAELERFLAGHELARYTEFTEVDRGELGEQLRVDRERGWSIVDQEFDISVRSIAVPIRRGDGAVVAAMGVVSPPGRLDADEIAPRFLEPLRRAADSVSNDLARIERLAATVLDPRIG